jgi:hypothetical protein
MYLSLTVGVRQTCYDNDILPEEAILAWGKKPSKKYLDKDTAAAVRKLAQPVLAWLEYGAAPSCTRLSHTHTHTHSLTHNLRVLEATLTVGFWCVGGTHRTAEEESDEEEEDDA